MFKTEFCLIPFYQNWNKWSAYDINEKSVIGNNFIMDLHIELIQAQHRVAVKLLNLPQGKIK